MNRIRPGDVSLSMKWNLFPALALCLTFAGCATYDQNCEPSGPYYGGSSYRNSPSYYGSSNSCSYPQPSYRNSNYNPNRQANYQPQQQYTPPPAQPAPASAPAPAPASPPPQKPQDDPAPSPAPAPVPSRGIAPGPAQPLPTSFGKTPPATPFVPGPH